MDDASITFQLTCVRDINSGANTVIKCAGRSSGIKYKVGTGEKKGVCVCENVCGPKHPWPLTGLVCLTVGKANSMQQETLPSMS